tara:strand:+ start:2700 stop:3071 length:372 start_codon:yes stop_codon:yes gene_type:complete
MVIKSFQIDWEGVSETIEYEDDITYGEMEAILSNSIDLSDVSKPKVNIPQYRTHILLKVLKKAPFAINDAVALRNIKQKQASLIMKEVMVDYPLVKYLGDWVETFTGSQIETETTTQSTTSVQ